MTYDAHVFATRSGATGADILKARDRRQALSSSPIPATR
jgi:hypothetical protein